MSLVFVYSITKNGLNGSPDQLDGSMHATTSEKGVIQERKPAGWRQQGAQKRLDRPAYIFSPSLLTSR